MFELLLNSLLLAAATCAIAVPVGVVLAVLVARTDLPGRRTLAALLVAPVLVPLIVQVAAWQSGFGLWGWYTRAVGAAPWLDGWHGAITVHAAAGVCWVVLIVGTALRFAEPELEEQALLDATAATVFRRVTLRRTAWATAIAVLWIAVWTMAEMTVTDFFRVRTFAEVVYTELMVEPGAVPLRALGGSLAVGAMAMVGIVLTAALVAPSWSPPPRPPLDFWLGRSRWPAFASVAAGAAVTVGLPLVNLIVKAGVELRRTPDSIQRIWSAAKCLRIVAESPWRYARELQDSVRISLVAATLAMVVATLLAWWACRRRGGVMALCLTVALTLAVPGPIVGLGLIELFNRGGVPALVWLYDATVAAPIFAQAIRVLAPATIFCWYALRSVPKATLESAALDGASSLATLVRVAIAQRWEFFAATWFVAFALAFGELPATILVEPPGVTTLPVRIFGLLHAGNEDEVAGICLGLVMMFALLAGVTGLLLHRGLRPSRGG